MSDLFIYLLNFDNGHEAKNQCSEIIHSLTWARTPSDNVFYEDMNSFGKLASPYV